MNCDGLKTNFSEVCDVPTLQREIKPLVLAAQDGETEKIRNILRGTSRAVIKDHLETALLAAARNNHVETCRSLLEYGADCNKAVSGKTSLWIAAFHRHLNVVVEMLATKRCTEENMNKSFLLCAEMDCFEGCVALLEAGASVNYTAGDESGPYGKAEHIYDKPAALHYATDQGNEELVKLLINNGANVNASAGNLRKTPLHLAVGNDSLKILELLLNTPSISSNVCDSENNTALTEAIKLRKKECVRVFIQHEQHFVTCMSVKIRRDDAKYAIDTPMRLMIRNMPDVASECLDQCIQLNDHRDPKHPDYTARFYYAFLDDTYACSAWLTANADSPAVTDVYEDIQEFATEVTNDGNDRRGCVGGPGRTTSAIAYDWSTRFATTTFSTQAQQRACDAESFCCEPGILQSRCRVKRDVRPYTDAKASLRSNHPLTIAYNEKATQVLCHPVSVSLINHKWRKAVRFYCYGRLILMLLYVTLLTVHVYWSMQIVQLKDACPPTENESTTKATVTDSGQDNEQKSKSSDESHLILDPIIFILTCLFLGKEIFALYSLPTMYISRLENFSDLLLYTLAITLTVIFRQHAYVWKDLASACVFLAWFNISLALRKIPVIGIFFVMFTKILKNSVIVLFIFIPILLGFSFTFNILLNSLCIFQLKYSFSTVLVMLSGEVEYANTLDGQNSPRNAAAVVIAYCLFIIIMVICLLNLLVGIAVSDVEKLRDEAESERMTLKAEEVISCEFYLPECLRRKLARGCWIFHPNRTSFVQQRDGYSLKKKLNTWLNKLDFDDTRLLSAEKLQQIKTRKVEEDDRMGMDLIQLSTKIDKCTSKIEVCMQKLSQQGNT